ncbi:hypothetical protein, partial [Pseudomonas viridiflava]|uniref:hypothetical protein n=1 Tax=Pseudomonas viridiflava TaxID=33069 RepID=UPI00197F2FFB
KRSLPPTNIYRLKYSIRGQTERRRVRSHKIQFLQWFTDYLIRGGLPAMQPARCRRRTALSFIAGKPPPTRPCSSGCFRHRADTFDVGTAKAQKAKGFPLALWLLPLSVNLTVDQKSPRKVRT